VVATVDVHPRAWRERSNTKFVVSCFSNFLISFSLALFSSDERSNANKRNKVVALAIATRPCLVVACMEMKIFSNEDEDASILPVLRARLRVLQVGCMSHSGCSRHAGQFVYSNEP
jgi:hypothetical protein